MTAAKFWLTLMLIFSLSADAFTALTINVQFFLNRSQTVQRKGAIVHLDFTQEALAQRGVHYLLALCGRGEKILILEREAKASGLSLLNPSAEAEHHQSSDDRASGTSRKRQEVLLSLMAQGCDGRCTLEVLIR